MHRRHLKKILVTGAPGLIGVPTGMALHEAGYEVIGLGRRIAENEHGFPSQRVKADLQDPSSASVLEAVHPDLITHCAGVFPVVHNGREADQAAEINRKIDDRVIDYCRENTCSLVYASTTSVYPMGESLINEESPVLPQGPYAQAKWESEEKITKEVERFVILRINAPYGRKQRANTVLRSFIERVLSSQPIYYYGSGKREQDFVAIEDVARAFVCAAAAEGINTVFNIAGGWSISMRQLAEMIIRLVPGTTSRVMASGQPDPQENYRARFDIRKAREVLGWTPSITLEEGIHRWVFLNRRLNDEDRTAVRCPWQ